MEIEPPTTVLDSIFPRVALTIGLMLMTGEGGSPIVGDVRTSYGQGGAMTKL